VAGRHVLLQLLVLRRLARTERGPQRLEHIAAGDDPEQAAFDVDHRYATDRLLAEDRGNLEDVGVGADDSEVAPHVLGYRSRRLVLVVGRSNCSQSVALTEDTNKAFAFDDWGTGEASLDQIVNCVENLTVVAQDEDGPLHDVLGQQHGSARIHNRPSYGYEC